MKEGVIVKDVLVGKPAAQAGLHAGDVITYIDGQKITSGPMLLDIIASSPVDRSVQVKDPEKREGTDNSRHDRRSRKSDLRPGLCVQYGTSWTLPFQRIHRIGFSASAVQVAPQKVVKQFGAVRAWRSAQFRKAASGQTFSTPLLWMSPYVIDSIVVDGRVTEVRAPADLRSSGRGIEARRQIRIWSACSRA